MLSRDQNNMLTQTDADTPMGAYFRRFWQPVALAEELPRSRRAARTRSMSWAKNSSHSGIVMVMLGCWTPIARTVGPIFSLVATKNAAFAASTTAGNSIATAKRLICPMCQQTATCIRRLERRLIPQGNLGDIIWVYMGPKAKSLPGGVLPDSPKLEFAWRA